MKKNKLLIVSLSINLILIIILIVLDIKINEIVNQKNTIQYIDTNGNTVTQKYYHCETQAMIYDDYTISTNYDFTFFYDVVKTSSFYEKYSYLNQNVFEDDITDEESKEIIIDKEKLIEYYPINIKRNLNKETLEDYIKRIENEFSMTCKESNNDDIMTFN